MREYGAQELSGTSKKGLQGNKVKGQGTVADNARLASRGLAQLRTLASQSKEGMEAFAQEVKLAKTQLKASCSQDALRCGQW